MRELDQQREYEREQDGYSPYGPNARQSTRGLSSRATRLCYGARMDKPRRPIRQWAVDSDDPYIARTPEEIHLYFKRRREVAGAKLREAAPRLRAG